MISMKTISSLILIVAAGSALAAQASAKQKIAAYYTKSDALTLKKDIPGLSKLLTNVTTSDFVSIEKPNEKGVSAKKTRAETLAVIAQVIPLVDKFDRAESHIEKYTPGSGSIVVTVTTSVAITTKPDPKGKVHKLVDIAKSDDTWVKVGADWKLKSSKTLSEKMTENGQPFTGS